MHLVNQRNLQIQNVWTNTSSSSIRLTLPFIMEGKETCRLKASNNLKRSMIKIRNLKKIQLSRTIWVTMPAHSLKLNRIVQLTSSFNPQNPIIVLKQYVAIQIWKIAQEWKANKNAWSRILSVSLKVINCTMSKRVIR